MLFLVVFVSSFQIMFSGCLFPHFNQKKPLSAKLVCSTTGTDLALWVMMIMKTAIGNNR